MRPVLDTPLHNREPNPGLLGIGVTLPSVPILSPILSQVVGGSPASPKPSPAPSTAPIAPPQRPPPSPAPTASNPSGGGGQGGGGAPSPGGSSGNSGTGGSNPPSSGGSSGGQGNGDSPSSSGGNSGDGGENSSSPGSGSPQGNSDPDAPSGSTPSAPDSGTSPGSGGSSGAEGSLIVSGSSTFRVTPTGVVALPLNNAAASPSSGETSPSDSADSVLGQSASPTDASGAPITPMGSQGGSGSSHTTVGGSSAKVGGGNDGNSGGTDANPASSSGSHSTLSSGAIGGIVAAVLIVCLVLVAVILRSRYKRRKDVRHVEWLNGFVGGENPQNMLQRGNSLRSSWGTPVERRFSNPFRRSFEESPTDFEEGFFHNPESHYSYDRSETGAPVLPMPVHSPTNDRSRSPEDPFTDAMASGLAQPIRRMSSLPIRISLISAGSDNRDPFDDAHEYKVAECESIPDSAVSCATFGHGSRTGAGIGISSGTQAHFPLPPPTAGSSSTVFAIGSPRDTLQTPGILISFPDSPISPTFAASGTSSYPRRASVRQPFRPSQERRDEVHLDSGDQVSVVSVYEDGWAFVQREKNNERGLVPLTCLEFDNP